MPPWQQGPDLGIISASGIAEAGRRALQRFQELRISIPTNSRLERAISTVEAANGSPSSVPHERLAEAIRTTHEMRWISRALGSRNARLPTRLSNALATMLSGPDMPGDNPAKAKPRSLQFELYIAAILAAGRVKVDYAEPDLRMFYVDEWVGIAVKLPRSRRKVALRVREAVEQIERWTPNGIVALNVDGLIDEIVADGTPWTEVAATIDGLPEVTAAIAYLRTQPRVRTLLTLGKIVGWKAGTNGRPQLEMSDYLKWNTFGRSDDDQRKSDEFFTAFRAAFAQNVGY